MKDKGKCPGCGKQLEFERARKLCRRYKYKVKPCDCLSYRDAKDFLQRAKENIDISYSTYKGGGMKSQGLTKK